MPFFKPRFIVPLIVCVALLTWWLMPHHSAEDEAYYVSIFCHVDQQDSDRLLPAMQALIEGGNTDYALKKTRFDMALGEKVIAAWDRLSPSEKAPALTDEVQCRRLVGEQLRR